MNFLSPAYITLFADSRTENQLNILFDYMVADNNINYLHKFIMLNSNKDRILIHNLHVLKGYDAKKLVSTKGMGFVQSELSY